MERDFRVVTDEEIIELFFARKEEAIVLSEKKYGKYLFKTAENILGDEEDSRECVNDALFLLWTHIPPDRPKRFGAYISRLVRNLAIDRVKERTRQKRVPSEFVSAFDDLSEYLEDASSVEKEIDDKLLKECIESFVRSLSKRARYIFVCRYFSCFSVPQIAGLLVVSQRQVFKVLNKIKQNLKDQLEKEGFIHAER